MSIKNSSYTIGNRTRDLPACSAVPQPTAPPRAPRNLQNVKDSGFTYKKNGYPGEAYVVERNCSLERVKGRSFALSVVLIPVDTGLLCRRVAGTSNGTVIAYYVS
jgi:hypothetical protein